MKDLPLCISQKDIIDWKGLIKKIFSFPGHLEGVKSGEIEKKKIP